MAWLSMKYGIASTWNMELNELGSNNYNITDGKQKK